MRTLIVLILLVSTAYAEKPPAYLVQIKTTSPRDRVSVFEDWGSGALVDPRYIITCSHNIELAHTGIMVRFANGDEVEAEVFKREPLLDLCLLKLKTFRYEKPVVLTKQKKIKAGQTVTAWGYPGDGTSKASKFTGEVFPAIVLGGAWFRFRGQAGQGVSGGPVLLDGKLVGVEVGSFPVTGIRSVNTPQVRGLLKEIP